MYSARNWSVTKRSGAWRDTDHYYGRDAFSAEIHRRGFRAIENAGHVIVFCNAERVRIIRPPGDVGNPGFSQGEIS